MRKAKKLIALMVVFAMVFSTILPSLSFAQATDVEGTKYEESVEKLMALDIIKGYEDGTFKPEDTISRAEFATIVTYLIGLQDAAELSKNVDSKFPDVKTNEWYTGFINIASNEGIIKGYPDGTFRPDADVTYAEAITMLVQALGMGAVTDANGTWPSNYLAKASQIGITEDVDGVDGNAKAIRGDVAIMSFNTLTKDKWGAKGYNDNGEITYGSLGKTLLADKYPDYVYEKEGKLEAIVFDNAVITGVANIDRELENNQVEIEIEGIAAALKITSTTASTTKAYKSDESGNKIVTTVAEGINTSNLLGREVEVMFGKNNVIVYIQELDTNTVKGTIDSIDAAGYKLEVNDKDYSVSKEARLYINDVEITSEITATEAITTDSTTKLAYLEELNTDLSEPNMNVTLIQNSKGKATSINVSLAGTFTIETTDDTDSDYKFDQFIVEAIRNDSTVVGLDGTRHFKVDDVDEKDNKIIMTKNGKEATGEDIEIGDLVNYSKLPDGNIRSVNVTTETVSGTLESIAKDYTLTVDGQKYKPAMNSMLSTSGELEDAKAMTSDIATLLKDEITMYLDPNGNYLLVMGESEETLEGQYGIIARTPIASDVQYDDESNPYMKLHIIDENGVKQVYTLRGEAEDEFQQVKAAEIIDVELGSGEDWTDKAITDLTKGTFVQFSTQSSGRDIDVTDLIKLENSTNAPSNVELTDEVLLSKLTINDEDGIVNDDNKSFKDSTGKTYYVNDETVILNQNADKLERLDGWRTLVNNSDADSNMLRGTTPLVIYKNNSRLVKYLVITDDGTGYQQTQDNYGVIMDIYAGENAKEQKVWLIDIYTNGETQTYEIDDIAADISSAVYGEEGDLIRYDLDDGKFVQTDSTDVKIDISAWEDNDNFDSFISDSVNDKDQLVVSEVYGKLVIFNEVDDSAIDPITMADDVTVYDLSGKTPAMSDANELEGRTIMYFDSDGDASKYEIIIILE